MTLTRQPECTLLEVHTRLPDLWCVYEIYLHDPNKDEKTLVYINSCPLRDVTRLTDLNRNTHWAAISKRGSYIYLKIIATGAKLECISEARRHLRAHNPLPECNALGYRNDCNAKGLRRSDGVEFRTQQAAAEATGASQSSISLHLRGKLAHVKGYTFTHIL